MEQIEINKLIQAADNIRKNAHVPFSNFRVGCAVLMQDGSVFLGVNIENASFGATICAERSAMGSIVTAGLQTQVKALAVVTDTEQPSSPCGICRQFLSEFLAEETPIILANSKGQSLRTCLKELLPMSFTKKQLGK